MRVSSDSPDWGQDGKGAERIDLPRGRRDELLRECVARYTAVLEEFCLEQPYQWFNFYDFWQED